jgi:hypothetical protein
MINCMADVALKRSYYSYARVLGLEGVGAGSKVSLDLGPSVVIGYERAISIDVKGLWCCHVTWCQVWLF